MAFRDDLEGRQNSEKENTVHTPLSLFFFLWQKTMHHLIRMIAFVVLFKVKELSEPTQWLYTKH